MTYYLLIFRDIRGTDGKTWLRSELAESLSRAVDMVADDIEANGYCTLKECFERHESGIYQFNALHMQNLAERAIASEAADRRSDAGLKAWHEGRML